MKKRINWLYPLLFLAFFDLHALNPILPSFLVSLGSSAAMLGFILSGYSAASMGGNIVAGPLIDRFGSKPFIVISLLLAGLLLFLQGLVADLAVVFSLRLTTGFAIAFLTPACFALLGKQGEGIEEQGRIMAKNGMMLTLASLISPLVGGVLADKFGFNVTFWILGTVLVFGAFIGWQCVEGERTAALGQRVATTERSLRQTPHRKRRNAQSRRQSLTASDGMRTVAAILTSPALLPALFTALTTTLGQGILMYEVPYTMVQQGESSTATGFLLTMMGLGQLTTLSQGWLNRYSPYDRCFFGLLAIAAVFYTLALKLALPLALLLFLKGAAHGLLFPAKTTIMLGGAGRDRYGTVFGVHSALMSSGFVIGPLIAGSLRTLVSPYFVAFLITMAMIVIFILLTAKAHIAPVAWRAR
ncbi:MFS transporter [Numidum massiliense]|uniref:MFS transporter n=1 Tax=Numidum massiliense TaxID=1522315 RepID=UPI0006D55BE3|nr:MFS transporter [Numidum massiliense]